MKKESALNLGSKLVFFNGLFALSYAFMVMIFNDIILEEHFKHAGTSIAFVMSENPELVHISLTLLNIIGIAGVVVGILIMYFASFCYKQGTKSAWWVWLMSGSIGWGGIIFIESSLWTPVTMAMAIIGFAIFLASAILPAHAVFSNGKKLSVK